MWIKICGVREIELAEPIAKLGPSAIGLNFYAPSRRSVSPELATRIAAAMPAEMSRVGVFVNHPLDRLLEIVDKCRIDVVQLHGDETPEFLAELKQKRADIECIRAMRIPVDEVAGLDVVDRYLNDCRELDACPAAILLDAHTGKQYGGTGQTIRWDAIAAYAGRVEWPRWILSGGLSPENVGEAVKITQPHGVDVASGVEDTAGRQSLERIRRFIEAARQPGGTPRGVDTTGKPSDG